MLQEPPHGVEVQRAAQPAEGQEEGLPSNSNNNSNSNSNSSSSSSSNNSNSNSNSKNNNHSNSNSNRRRASAEHCAQATQSAGRSSLPTS